MNLKTELREYGITADSTKLFSAGPSPEVIDYLDLIETRKQDCTPPLMPDGVAESQGRPLLFFVNSSRLAILTTDEPNDLRQLRRQLACRGQRAYLAVIEPGSLRVVPVSLADRTPKWFLYRAGTADAITFFGRLANGQFDGTGEPKTPDSVFRQMFGLLQAGADRIAKRIGRADALSLAGRALFFRFLRDRSIVTEKDARRIAPRANELKACFDDSQNAFDACQWLDRTFNGDFLPLSDTGSRAFFDNVAKHSSDVYSSLKAIVRGDREPVGTGAYQLNFHWGQFDFAHVPVGLLSQVYEAFSWKWDLTTAKETSVHYTPRSIASSLVSEAFDGLPKPHLCRVLDPACGAGVFLVLAFRRLYFERWRTTRMRPETKDIREILETQLAGFDISESALRLAALSLYLTAIELDPEPVPPENLLFKELRDRVLFNHRRQNVDPENGPVIGSLGDHVGDQFNQRFELVISNPPWTSLSKKEKALADRFTAVSKDVIARKDAGDLAFEYRNPDSAPDLPFLWRSTEWCTASGRIAMALPARILLKQEDIPRRARETLFRLIEVTGIVNGCNLADTRVWPDMNQPFILLFARNKRPTKNHVIRVITPVLDNPLNGRGEMQIDSNSSEFIDLDSVINEPWLLKALAIGTSLDADVIRKVKDDAARQRPLGTYWKDLGLKSGNGYQVAGKQDQQDASFLHGLPDLNSTELFRFQVDPNRLQPFARVTLAWPRKREIYSKPLVLINVTPGEHRNEGRALLAFSDIAFNESFNGYSGAGHPSGSLAVRYLHLLAHSNIWSHYTLAVSAEFGAERRKLQKIDFDDFPIVKLDSLSETQRDAIQDLSTRLVAADETVFAAIDSFFGRLYRLNSLDLEVINDTLSVALPFDEARKTACRRPSEAEATLFCGRIKSALSPFFKALGKSVSVIDTTTSSMRSPYGVIVIADRGISVDPSSDFERDILRLAADTGATQIIEERDGALYVGIRSQYRYWTSSRARLLAATILGEHMAVFEE